MLIAAKALERHIVLCPVLGRLGELRIARDDALDLRIIVKRSVGVGQDGEHLRRLDIEASDSAPVVFEHDAFRSVRLEQLDKLIKICNRRIGLGLSVFRNRGIGILLGIVSGGIPCRIVAFRLIARGIGTRGTIDGITRCGVALHRAILGTVTRGTSITRPRPIRGIAVGLAALGSIQRLRRCGSSLIRDVLPACRHSSHRGRACLEHHDHHHELCEYALCRSHRFRTSYPKNSASRVIESPSCPSG